MRLYTPPPVPHGPKDELGRMDPAPPPVRGWTTQPRAGAGGCTGGTECAVKLVLGSQLPKAPVETHPSSPACSPMEPAPVHSPALSSPLPEPQSTRCCRSGSRQALDDGGDQVTGVRFSSSAFVPAGRERSAALGSGRARRAAGCGGGGGGWGTAPAPRRAGMGAAALRKAELDRQGGWRGTGASSWDVK